MAHEYCFGCMEEIDGYPCPHCGYNGAAETKPYALRPGTILRGRYLVGKVLGQGGFGITYIGMDLQLQRKLAIKEYYPSSYACRQDNLGTVHWYSKEVAQEARISGREMFLKEARKMSQVSHIPEVVQVYDMFQENDTAYICMDFIDGITLMNRLKADGPMSWEEAKQIFLPAMTVLEQVHKAGLVHRDISPDNIMIQRDGSIRILDLGAAKDLNVNSGLSSMQVAKSGFSPPEQYMQRGNSGSWTDVYAMAATMYYALTGKLPLPAMDRMNPEGDNLDWNLLQLQALPKAVRKALQHAMALKISDRTQNMEALAKELTASPAPQPIPNPIPQPSPQPVPQPIPKPEPEHKSTPNPKPKPRRALIAVAAGLLLVGGFFLTKPMFKGEQDTPKETTPVQIHATTEATVPEVIIPEPVEEVKPVSVAASGYHTIVLMSDGTLQAFGKNNSGQCNISHWSDIVSVSAGSDTTYGIKRDGTIIYKGYISYSQLALKNWYRIVSIDSSLRHTVGLKDKGTVVAAGDNSDGQCDVSQWTEIVAIEAGYFHTVGLKSDGTVVATGSNEYGQCNVNDWRDIIAISAGSYHTVGIKRDGTVVAAGLNCCGECDVSQWTDIVSISAHQNITVAVNSSGKVFATGNNEAGQCNVSEWENVVSVSAGAWSTAALTADGRVLATGSNKFGQCDIDLSQ